MAEETAFDWGKFDRTVDTEALEQDVAEAENVSDFPDIPDGTYDVTVIGMELSKSKVKDNGKGGDPMVKIQFQIMAGEFEGQRIFYNGVIQMWQKDSTRRFQIHNVNTMLRAIANNQDLSWKNFAELDALIKKNFEEVGTFKNDDDSVDEGLHFELEQKTNSRNANFKDLEILSVLDDEE